MRLSISMAVFCRFSLCFLTIAAAVLSASCQLNPDFYDESCPQALPTIKAVVQQAVHHQPRMGASLLRLHFHDCFVNGCDGSVLLDDAPNFVGEKTAVANINSLKGFEVVDEIKAAVNSACNGNVVSCSDILAVAARDSVVALGGRYYQVLLGRRDAVTTSKEAAEISMPLVFLNYSELLSNFNSHGLSLKDLVVLSGAHTVGLARCSAYSQRIRTDNDIDLSFAKKLQAHCSPSEEGHLRQIDKTPKRFDTKYFEQLVQRKTILHSDQQLFRGDGGESDLLVMHYVKNPDAFMADFGESMIKMGNIRTLTGKDGEIRKDCRRAN